MLYRPMFCSWPDETEGKPFRATVTHSTFLAEAGRSMWPVGFQIKRTSKLHDKPYKKSAGSCCEALEKCRGKESIWASGLVARRCMGRHLCTIGGQACARVGRVETWGNATTTTPRWMTGACEVRVPRKEAHEVEAIDLDGLKVSLKYRVWGTSPWSHSI